jgi:hypothetical protein
MCEADERLRRLLRDEPPATVLALPEADRCALADLLTETRARQADSLRDAFEATLTHVPFPIRRIVRKVLTG